MLLFVDTDANPVTGDPESLGADYVIQIFGGEAALFRWDGTNFTRRAGDPPATSLIFSYQGGVTITISAAELGNTKKLGFAVIAISGVTIDPATGDLDFTNAVGRRRTRSGRRSLPVRGQDHAADARRAQPQADAQDPDAGRPFTLKLVAARSDTGAVVQNGRVTCVGRIGQRATQGAGSARAGWGGDMHVEHPVKREGEDVPWLGGGRVRGLESGPGVLGQGSLAPPPVRRLALLASLLAAVAITGTAAGSLDRTPRDVIEQALAKVRPAPDFSGVTQGPDNRVRVIVTLDDPPLAAATFARRLPGPRPNAKLNSRLGVLALVPRQPRGRAGESDRELREEIPEAIVSPSLPGARERVRRERAVRATSRAPRRRGREPRLPELHVHA